MKVSKPSINTDNHLDEFLTGRSFSNFEKFQYDKKSFIPNRLDLLDELLKDKIVLHFGCCDHENLIEEKIRNNSHLQVKLANIAGKCIGVDNNLSGINKLKNLQVENCYYYDLFKSENPEIENENFDYILLGEILEHISDPVAFLTMIRLKFKNSRNIIITVPNAFSSKNFYNIKRGIEEINTDHRYWFTPYTLAKVATEAGYKFDCLYFVDRSRISVFDKVIKWYYYFRKQDAFIVRKWSIRKSIGLVAICKFH
jgi:2-polyprenyl-3-methyl-5-hydroxy-6-metoxy-1,4-benzoquinol methylase